MKTFIDRTAVGVSLVACGVLLWSVFSPYRPELSSNISRVCLLVIISAMFARGAYGSSKPVVPHEFAVLMFWLSIFVIVAQVPLFWPLL